MAIQPICPKCGVACIVGSTTKGENGNDIQYRYCPVCRAPYKTPCSELK